MRCASNVLPPRGEVEVVLEALGRGPLGHLGVQRRCARSRLMPYLAASRSVAVPSAAARRLRVELEDCAT